ncbi:T9SS sorting signal type C domain-containing protein [Flavobacterium sp. 3-210]
MGTLLVFANSVSGQTCTNLITNGDFSSTPGNAGWIAATAQGIYAESNPENTYFSSNNSDATAELDKDASLRQTVSVVSGNSYTVSFIYARRPDTSVPATVAVDFRVISGATILTFPRLTTTTSTPQVGTFTFIAPSNSIALEFYNSLHANLTLGTIIDNIVLIPTSQVAPVATTVPKGNFKTLTVCANTDVNLDVENVPASGITYSWTGSAGAVFSSTTAKSPSVKFTSSTPSIQQVTVTATGGGCSASSTTFVYVNPNPSYNVTGSGSYCSGGIAVGLDGSTTGFSYQLKLGGVNSGTAVAGNGSAITFGTKTAGTYTVVATNSTTGCTLTMNGSAIITAATAPAVSITGSNNICVGSTTNLSPTSGGTWTSSNSLIASVTNAGVVTGVATGSATFTFTSSTSTNCSSTTAAIAVSSGATTFDTSSTFTVPSGVTILQVECWGAGGGGASGGNASGGGGGGAYTKGTLTSLTAGQNLTITVGIGGAIGTNGGSSSVNTIVANGGSSGSNRTGGAGGVVSAITGSVTVSYSGYKGGDARANNGGGNNEAGGGGGGSAMINGTGGTDGANGGSSTTAITAGGAGTGNGGGGAAADGNPDAVAGALPGGGGGGRGEGSSSSKSGANGRVIITVPSPTATAGSSQTICQNGTATVSGASFTNGTILWTHNGSGSLTNATTLTPIYTAAAGDAGNTVILTMTVSNGPCVTPATATYSVVVKATPTASAGGSQSICQNGTATVSGASSSNGTILWSHNGLGSLTNATTLTPTYTPASGDAGNTVTLTMTVSNSPCTNATATYSVVVKATPTANAGGSQSICQNGTATVSGASSSNGTILWSHNGLGSLTNAATLTPTYTPASGDAGNTVTLTMTVSNSPCTNATATYSVVVKATPTASAGGSQSICQNGTATVSGASSSNGTILWSHNGLGSLTNATTLTPTYTPASGDAGNTVTLTMTVSNSPCTNATATYSVVVKATPTASAGGSQSICQNGTATVSGASSSNGTILWSHNGLGSLTNAATLTPTYTPASGDAGNTVTLTMTVSNSPCTNATATYSVVVKATPTASAGGSQSICQNGTATVSGASSSNGTILWSHNGLGSLTNATTLTPTYTPALGDAGNTVTLTMTVSNSPCTNAIAIYTVVVNPLPTANTGTPLSSICQGATSVAMGGSVGGGATGGTWSGGTGSWTNPNDVANATYTAGLTESGSITLTLTTTGGSCGILSVTKTVTVNPIPTVNAITGGATSTCVGSSTPAFANTTPSGVWSIINGTGSATVNSSGVVTGVTAGNVTVVYTVTNGNSCSNTATIGLIIDPNHPAPTAGTPTRPTCSAGASVTLSGLPASGNLLQNDGTSIITIPFLSNTHTITGLVPGTYRFAVDNGCAVTYSAPVVVMANTFTGGSSWTYGAPNSDDYINFASGYTISADVTYCSVTVSNGAAVTVAPGKTLTVTNGVHVVSGSTLTFENSSNLIQTSTSNTLNTGNIFYNRIAPKIRQADYVYWSTPVKNQTLAALSSLTASSKLYAYDGNQWVFTPRTTIMAAGKGYIVRGPENYSNTVKQDFPASFFGTPQNGTFTGEAMVGGKYYLLGNPYPSALDATAFITDVDNRDLLSGTLYFWTHNTPVVLGGAYQYATDDYATWNLSGGTGTRPAISASDPDLSGDNPNGDTPSGQIGAGQAFFTGTVMSGNVTYKNSMRVGGNSNGQFFKPGKTAKTAEVEKHRVWLNMTNEGGAFKQLLVAYIEGATNDYERLYDGKTFDGNKYLDFYSINEGNKLVIQGRGLPFTDVDQVPLGYRTTVAGDFTIAINRVDGNMKTQAIYIEDKKIGTIHDLRASNYTFTTEIGTFADRLVLRYTNKSLGTGDFENIEKGITVSGKDKVIKLLSSNETIQNVAIYDVAGKLLYDKKKVGSNELLISNLQSSNQLLLIDITLENGYKTTRKLIFQ